MDLVTLGYYICEPAVNIYEKLKDVGNLRVSISGCLGTQHPVLTSCFWMGYLEEKETYRKKWKMDEETFCDLKKDVADIFQKHLIEVDSRFVNLEQAEYFYRKYFNNSGCMLVSVSVGKKYQEILEEEITFSGNNNCPVSWKDYDNAQEVLGCDIVGWDVSGFHSFLCNYLHLKLPEVRFNSFGLIDNQYEETETFAKRIEGQGEPVIWIPCQIGRCR